MEIDSVGSQVTVNYTQFPNRTYFTNNHNESVYDIFNYDIIGLEGKGAFKKPFEIINFVTCILGLMANGMSIIATAHIPQGLTTHSKLIISLCVSDSLILAAVISNFFTYINSSWVDCFTIIKRVLQDTAVLATLLNLLAMAGEHYLAIMKPLCYQRFMNNRRANCLIVTLWIFSLFVGLLEVIIGSLTEADILLSLQLSETGIQMSFCTKIFIDEYDVELIMTIIIFVVLFAVVTFYMRIYFVVKSILRRDEMLYQDEQHNHKATVTTMLIIGTFVLLWTPFAIFKIYTSLWPNELNNSNNKELDMAHNILFLLLLVNSLADPLIYAIRLHEVQKGYKVLLLKLFPNRRFSINEEEFRNQHFTFCSRRRDTIPTIVHDNTSIPSPDGEKALEFNKGTEESSFMLNNSSEQNRKNCTAIF